LAFVTSCGVLLEDPTGGGFVDSHLGESQGLGGRFLIAGFGRRNGALGPGLELGPRGLVSLPTDFVLPVALDLGFDVRHVCLGLGDVSLLGKRPRV